MRMTEEMQTYLQIKGLVANLREDEAMRVRFDTMMGKFKALMAEDDDMFWAALGLLGAEQAAKVE